MKVVERQIAELKPAHYNPRKISDADFEQLKKSLEKFEAVEPAIINKAPGREDIIVGGHQRLKAARALGWATFPCVEVMLTEAEERELNIRLNRNTGEWDLEALLGNFQAEELLEFGFDASEFPLSEDGLGEDFSLKDGDREPFISMTFRLADEQAEALNSAIEQIKSAGLKCETFGNENQNGNALYQLVLQWARQKN